MARGHGAHSNGNNARKRRSRMMRDKLLEEFAAVEAARDRALEQNRSLAAALESCGNRVRELERQLAERGVAV